MQRFLLVGVLSAALAAAGCAGQSAATAKGTPTPAQREAAFDKFTQCMRDHGINMADPTTDANGNLQLSRPTGIQFNNQSDRQKLRTARQACQSNLKGIVQQFTPQQRAQLQDNLLKLAQCMRSNGVNMPDPNFSQDNGGGGRERFFGGINPQDPKVRQALQTCRTQVFGNQNGPGGGIGRGGGFFFGGGGGGGG
jgi:hypothetical protein